MTTSEVGKLLGLSAGAVRKKAQRHGIEPIDRGRRGRSHSATWSEEAVARLQAIAYAQERDGGGRFGKGKPVSASG